MVHIAVYLGFSAYGYTSIAIPLVLLLATVLLLVSYRHPYKIQLFNIVDSVFIILIITASVMLTNAGTYGHGRGRGYISKTDTIVLGILMAIGLAYLPCLMVYVVYSRSSRLQAFTGQIKALFSRQSSRPLLQH